MSSFIKTPLGYNIHYLSSGDPTGHLAICMHGLGGSTDTFTPLLPLLSKSFSVVCVDFPGFGESPRPELPRRISIADHVANLHHLITSLQDVSPTAKGRDDADTTVASKKRVLLLGHSMGSVVALQYAALHPDTMAGVFALGAGRSGSRIPPARSAMIDLAAQVRAEGIKVAATKAMTTNFYADKAEHTVDPTLRQAVYDAVVASDPEGYAQSCEAMISDAHVDPDYAKITCPVVFVAGDKDMISPVSRSEDLATLVGGPATVQRVRSGHQLILEDLDGVKMALVLFSDMVHEK